MIERDFRKPSQLELCTLGRMLVLQIPETANLLSQLAVASVKTIDEYGSIRFKKHDTTVVYRSDPIINARQADRDTEPGQGPFINYGLFLKAGRLHELRISKDDGRPLIAPLDPTKIVEVYPGGPAGRNSDWSRRPRGGSAVGPKHWHSLNPTPITIPEDTFAPIVGQLVWSVRGDPGSTLTMEFGPPRLVVEDAMTSTGTTAVRRRIQILGHWHVSMLNTAWEISTKHHRVTSRETDVTVMRETLDELSGQRLVSVETNQAASACILFFDLGGSMRIDPDLASEKVQWTLEATHDKALQGTPAG